MVSARLFGGLQRWPAPAYGGPAMDRLAITVPCDLRYRDAVGALIQQICHRLEQQGAVAGLEFQVLSAFNEAFNNLVQYAYQPGVGEVDVHLELGGEELVVELQDSGRSFEFEQVEAPDLVDDLPESGLGIFIIRSCMSDVRYEPGTGSQKNRLRMIRRLDERDPAALSRAPTPQPGAPRQGREDRDPGTDSSDSSRNE